MKNGCEFAIRKKQPEKAFKNQIWERLGLHLGGFGGGFGRDLEALGVSWVVFGALFLMLVFGVVFKHALGGILAGLWLDLRGLGKGFGRNFQAFWGILGYCGFFWVIGVFLIDFCMIFAGAPYCLLLLSWSSAGV